MPPSNGRKSVTPSGSSSAAVGANKEAVNAKDSEADIHKEADVAAMTPANDAQDTAVVAAKLVGPLGFLKKGFLKRDFKLFFIFMS